MFSVSSCEVKTMMRFKKEIYPCGLVMSGKIGLLQKAKLDS